MDGESAPGRPSLSAWAIVSVVVAIGGVVVSATSAPLPIFPSILAMIIAARARTMIRRSRGRLRGLGLAQLGWWLGIAGILTRIVVATITEARSPWLLAFVAIPIVVGILFALTGRSEEQRRVH